MLLLAVALASCAEFGANAVDGSDIRLAEGDRMIYENPDPPEFFFGPVLPDADRAEYRLISTIATIGGRENVNAFEFSRDRSIIFTQVVEGRVWQAFKASDGFAPLLEHNAVWLRIPRVGEEPVSGEVSDSTFFEDEEVFFTTPVSRRITITALASSRLYAGGYYFPAIKVRIDYDLLQDFSTHRVSEEVTYVETLGIVGEREFQDPQFFSTFKFILERIQLED